MAIPEETDTTVPEQKAVDEIIGEVAELIANRNYKDAYKEICKNAAEKSEDFRSRNYRDENLVANLLEPEIAEYLSEIVTGELYHATGSLEEKKEELDEFATEYLT